MSLIEGIVKARCKVAPDQHLACVEPFGQALDDESGFRRAIIRLPESRGPASVDLVVAMMKGNDSEPACAENAAAQYSRSASDQQIEIESLYLLDVLIGEPTNIARFGSDGRDLDDPIDDFGEIAGPVMVLVGIA